MTARLPRLPRAAARGWNECEVSRVPTSAADVERLILACPRAVSIEQRRISTGETIKRLLLFVDIAPAVLEGIDWARRRDWCGTRQDVANVRAGRDTRLSVWVRTYTGEKRVLYLQRTGEDGREHGTPMVVDEAEFDALEDALLALDGKERA